MGNSKKKSLLIIIPAFCIWIAVLAFCYSLFAEGYKYSLGYGVMLTPTITDEAGTSFLINYNDPGLSIYEYSVGDKITFCSYGHGYVYIGRHDPQVDLDNTHIFHKADGKSTEVSREELCDIIRNLEKGAPENTEMILDIDDSEFVLYPLKGIRFEGEYEGTLSITDDSIGIPKEYTDYDECVRKVESAHQKRLILASIVVIAVYIGLTIPMIIFAVKKNYLALYIYCILVLLTIWGMSYMYNDFSHRAIGINWYSRKSD